MLHIYVCAYIHILYICLYSENILNAGVILVNVFFQGIQNHWERYYKLNNFNSIALDHWPRTFHLFLVIERENP